MTISEKHAAAARINGAKSRGPVTAKGKAVSSRNATRHGLLAATVVLPNEDPESFQQLLQHNVASFHPTSAGELSLIEQMTAALWRLRRAMSMEKAILQTGSERYPDRSPVDQTAAAFRDPANAPQLDRLERYQVHLSNLYQRALNTVVQMRKSAARTAPQPVERADIAILRNEPSSPIVCNTGAAPDPARGHAQPTLTPGFAAAALSSLRFHPPEALVFP